MKRKILVAAVCLCLAWLARGYAQTSLKAEVDKTAMTTGELLTYKLVAASTEQDIPAPVAPRFAGFKVVSQAQSTTVSFQKNGARNVLVFVYLLLADSPGTYTIAPASLSFKGKSYTSGSFQIEVKQGSGRRQPQQPPVPAEPPQDQIPDSDQPKYIL